MPDFDRRLDALRARLEEERLSGLFLPESADVEYLTGVPRARNLTDSGHDAELRVEGCFIGPDAGPIFLFTSSEWSFPAAAAAARYEARRMPANDDPVAWLAAAARAVGIDGALGLGDRVPLVQLEALRAALPDTSLQSASRLVLELRMRKDDEEIELVRQAGAIAQQALESTIRSFGPGFKRSEFLRRLEFELFEAGSERLAYAPDLYAVGPATSIVWSADVVGDRDGLISAPASVTVDLSAVHRSYRSDIGRTVFVGEPPAGQEEALRTVRLAQDRAIEALRPGLPAEEVDRVARAILEEAELGDAFWIPSGHGIGLELHEPPRFRKGVTLPVPERAVVTVEIAAWREGRTAAFWEDDVVVHAAGAERLTSGPPEPFVIA